MAGTISTATWLPFSRLKSSSCRSSAARSLSCRNPARSTTGELAGGIAVSARANRQQKARQASSITRSKTVIAYCPAEAAPPKLTVGAVEMAFSFSTVKFGRGARPNMRAVRLLGKVRTVLLYACTAVM